MKIEISLPSWAIQQNNELPEYVASIDERMRIVIRFSRLNFQNETGGPFAAGVFEKESGKVIAVGVNVVIPSKISSAHAEIVALSLAQQRLNAYDLGGSNMQAHQLVVSGRPCAMCLGAIPWSGVRSVIVGASGEQIEKITGFDEGPIHPDWRVELESRGIEVFEDVLADEACDVLRLFAASGQMIYNARSGE